MQSQRAKPELQQNPDTAARLTASQQTQSRPASDVAATGLQISCMTKSTSIPAAQILWWEAQVLLTVCNEANIGVGAIQKKKKHWLMSIGEMILPCFIDLTKQATFWPFLFLSWQESHAGSFYEQQRMLFPFTVVVSVAACRRWQHFTSAELWVGDFTGCESCTVENSQHYTWCERSSIKTLYLSKLKWCWLWAFMQKL